MCVTLSVHLSNLVTALEVFQNKKVGWERTQTNLFSLKAREAVAQETRKNKCWRFQSMECPEKMENVSICSDTAVREKHNRMQGSGVFATIAAFHFLAGSVLEPFTFDIYALLHCVRRVMSHLTLCDYALQLAPIQFPHFPMINYKK